MVSGQERNVFEAEPTPAHGGHGFVCPSEPSHGGFAQGDKDARLDDDDLLAQVRKAPLHFQRGGWTVSRRAFWHVGAAFEDVGDVDIVAGQSHGVDDFGKEFPGASDKWLALLIFVRSRRFADEHQLRIWVADTENSLRAECGQVLAFAAGADGLVQRG